MEVESKLDELRELIKNLDFDMCLIHTYAIPAEAIIHVSLFAKRTSREDLVKVPREVAEAFDIPIVDDEVQYQIGLEI